MNVSACSPPYARRARLWQLPAGSLARRCDQTTSAQRLRHRANLRSEYNVLEASLAAINCQFHPPNSPTAPCASPRGVLVKGKRTITPTNNGSHPQPPPSHRVPLQGFKRAQPAHRTEGQLASQLAGPGPRSAR
ncbi:hypothetical protein HYPSUDRAFT_200792 [Hypholoma sublateritium FD-334 SS-4]|uniref:Uncharacterized protein n=1 Tax=Hypholoma sublateritium (strain FD-334 SS-4) TaxID=945553 RepID=A0A0D2P044_HYPSF|nr:hypothetical protein HYPSUDRAFT_200792 [Hypholoma sublateritium FD-334 SS-4]